MQESAIEGADAPVSSLIRRAAGVLRSGRRPWPPCCSTMREQRIGSMIVADECRGTAGHFYAARRARPHRAGRELRCKCGHCCSTCRRGRSPRNIDSSAYQVALLAMIRHGVNHVVLVSDQGRLAGLISARDLFGLQSATLRQLSTAIRSARRSETNRGLWPRYRPARAGKCWRRVWPRGR